MRRRDTALEKRIRLPQLLAKAQPATTVPTDPTTTSRHRAGVRPADHEQRGHGAATDPASVWARRG